MLSNRDSAEDVVYRVMLNGELVGEASLIGLPFLIKLGRFVAGPAYEKVRPTFQRFLAAIQAEEKKVQDPGYKIPQEGELPASALATAALPLELYDDGGRRIHATAINIFHYAGDPAPFLIVLVPRRARLT